MAHVSFLSPLGPLSLFEEQGALVAVEFGRAQMGNDGGGGATALLAEARRQLEAYFAGRLTRFELPLAPTGTAFQKRVWAALGEIPYGRTQTYGGLARVLGTTPRPVGGALGRNPIPIIQPCHRVVGTGGRMTGYSGGGGVETKKALLRLEGAAVPG